MKKFGFTLSELIVALGIIGVVAAITMPTLNNLIPDKRKVTVMKAYKTAVEITSEILADPTYYNRRASNGANFCVGLGCDAQVLDNNPDLISARGAKKFYYIYTSKLYADSYDTGNKGYITTEDVMSWVFDDATFSGLGTMDDPREATIDFTVSTVEPDAKGDCTFSPACLKPQKFSFHIDTFGNITGNDELTKAFLANPNKLTGVGDDYKKAREELLNQ